MPDIEHCLYSVLIFCIRFLQGINWGYSQQLPHSELDQNTYKALIVNFNVIQKFKQAYRRDELIGVQVCKIEAFYSNNYSAELFLHVTSYSAMEEIVTYHANDAASPSKYAILPPSEWTSKFDLNPVYRHFYRKAKNEILIWLQRSKTWCDDEIFEDVDIDWLEKIEEQNSKTYDSEYLQKVRTEINGKPLEIYKKEFIIDNSDFIYVLQSPAWESKVIFESLIAEIRKQSESQELDFKARVQPYFEVLLYHVCHKRNKITCDSYFIMKHIVYQLSKVKAIRDYLLIQPDNYFQEFITAQKHQEIQIANAHTFVAFLKTISQVKIDYNFVVFLHGIENVYKQSDLDNFVMVLRAASHVMPPFLKFVFSAERRKSNFSVIDKTLKLLMSLSTSSIIDQTCWSQEADLVLATLKDQVENALGRYAAANQCYKSLCIMFGEEKEQLALENLDSEKRLCKIFETEEKKLLSFMWLTCQTFGPIEQFLLAEMYPDFQSWFECVKEFYLVFVTPASDNIYIVPRDRKMILKCIQQRNYYTQYGSVMREFLHRALKKMCGHIVFIDTISQYQVYLTPYFKTYIYDHLKALDERLEISLCETIHDQILWFQSFARLIKQLQQSSLPVHETKYQKLLVNLRLTGQTLRNERNLKYCDFYAQMKGRDGTQSDGIQCMYVNDQQRFTPIHESLRENQRLQHIIQLPPSQILGCRFLSDNQRVVFSFACGLCLLVDTVETVVQKVIVVSSACLDLIKIIDDKYLILAGLSEKVRVFNLDTEKLQFKFQPHSDQSRVNLMQIGQNMFFSYSSNEIAKWDLQTRKKVAKASTDAQVLKMKLRYNGLLTCQNKKGNFIIMYDNDLNLMFQTCINFQPQNIKKFLSVSKTDCLVYSSDGSIIVLNTEYLLEIVRKGSIFSLKSEDCIDILIIKSKDHYMFTIEKQKMDFYTTSNFKRTDTWDYFFPRPIAGCGKNRVGSKICVWDTNSTLSLFNFVKTNHPGTVVSIAPPMHKKQDQIQCLDVESQQIMSCSLDRELKIWNLATGKFVKRYDLTSFTNETITSMKMTPYGLFLGSKDMNIYLIDIEKGKLCVVYEGHWSKVGLIYQVPEQHILITTSESNVKIWDLEKDECIQSMNEHTSPIVYCQAFKADPTFITTISQDFEYKIWNSSTGKTVAQEILNLPPESQIVFACTCATYQNLVYLALDSHQVVVYDQATKSIIYSFDSYQSEDVIHLEFIPTQHADYLLVVTRTSCIVYLVKEHSLEKMASYILNASKSEQSKPQSKFSYLSRFYFTSCKVDVQEIISYRKQLPLKPDFNGHDLGTQQKLSSLEQTQRIPLEMNSVHEGNLDDDHQPKVKDEDQELNQEQSTVIDPKLVERARNQKIEDYKILNQPLCIEKRPLLTVADEYSKDFYEDIQQDLVHHQHAKTYEALGQSQNRLLKNIFRLFPSKHSAINQLRKWEAEKAQREAKRKEAELYEEMYAEEVADVKYVCTVILGDSRGVLHMTNLNLN